MPSVPASCLSWASPAAIASNIERVTGYDITVREPWQEIFFLSDPLRPSRLSGQQHLQGAPIYEYHTVQLISARGGVDWSAILREARADLPAGTKISVYTADGATLLYSYTTQSGPKGTPVIDSGLFNTGNAPFAQGPIYLNYGYASPYGIGSTDFSIW